ncbi:annexin A7 [Cordyceps fumosorosea ARSEF 2679]|uniref:Annexin A7 n=1 Tax=Cordyceps fumosorosea (strain ARSEF 2679) TaxID=1081104 RepID=A0A162LPP9_CORFA|nr:annexin A7 [Cordyceps fumosorosea ARSEF 2679]OAA73834.1 annexin A7 [Cordyceps fumosorosea ARSEF 2679]
MPSQAIPWIANECFTTTLQSGLAKPTKPEPFFPWSEEDACYTKLFRAWDNLPIHDASTETGLLMELDHIISHFDSYIGHSDLGFRSWVKRHQLAMELELVEMPTWPKLYTLQGDEKKWRDEAWVSRYSFLVRQREIIAKCRLQRMTGCTLEDKKRFFGLSWAYPRQTLRTVNTKHPARLRNRWYEPLEYCLARMAHGSCGRLDLNSLHAEF